MAVEDGVSVDEEVGLEGETIEEVSVVGVVDVVELLVGGWLLVGEVDVVELLVVEGGSVEGVDAVVGVGVVGVVDVLGLEGGSVVGVVDAVFELLVLVVGSVEGVDAVGGVGVVGAADDRIGWDEGSGVETGHSADARKEASCSWQLV